MRIREFAAGDGLALFEHCVRHCAESNEVAAARFSPMESTSEWQAEAMAKENEERVLLPVTQPGWARVWILEDDKKRILGACTLRGGALATGLHRCHLGMGLEKEARGMGHGWALMEAAITWAKSQDCLFWIDLYVFSHNDIARKLYDSFGFQTFGMVMDKFRVHGQSIDDIHMCLLLREE